MVASCSCPSRFAAARLLQNRSSNPALNASIATTPVLGCFQNTFADVARERAREVDRLVNDGKDPGPLAGVPVAVKDTIVSRNEITTCGSRILENFVSPYDATVYTRLLDAGAVPSRQDPVRRIPRWVPPRSTVPSGSVRNPWDTSRVPGGSSGGSAAAVAAGFSPASLGSDTGGSIRQPAALCGVVGIKPTYGRVSRYGLVSFGPSLDQVGPFARSVEDAAAILQVIAGEDVHDSTTIDTPVPDLLGELHSPIEKLRVAFPPSISSKEMIQRSTSGCMPPWMSTGHWERKSSMSSCH